MAIFSRCTSEGFALCIVVISAHYCCNQAAGALCPVSGHVTWRGAGVGIYAYFDSCA